MIIHNLKTRPGVVDRVGGAALFAVGRAVVHGGPIDKADVEAAATAMYPSWVCSHLRPGKNGTVPIGQVVRACGLMANDTTAVIVDLVVQLADATGRTPGDIFAAMRDQLEVGS